MILARLDSYLELLGPAWHAAFGGDLANITPLRFLAAGYADPHAVRRLGLSRLTRFVWRYSHGAFGELYAAGILAAAAETLQLWDGELSYPDLAEDIAASPPSARSPPNLDLDTKLAAQLHHADPHGILTSVPGVGIIYGSQILARLGDPDRFLSLAGARSLTCLFPSLTASGATAATARRQNPATPRSAGLFMAANAADPTLAARYQLGGCTRASTTPQHSAPSARSCSPGSSPAGEPEFPTRSATLTAPRCPPPRAARSSPSATASPTSSVPSAAQPRRWRHQESPGARRQARPPATLRPQTAELLDTA